MDNLDDMNFHRLKALENIRAKKIKIAKFYNQKVRERRFSEGDLVWKVILPIGSKDSRFGICPLIGKDHIGLLELLLGMLISMKPWKEENISELLMENILRNITLMSRFIYFSWSSQLEGCLDSWYIKYRLQYNKFRSIRWLEIADTIVSCSEQKFKGSW